MRAIAFLIGLVFFLLAGQGSVCSIVHHNNTAHSSFSFDKIQQPAFLIINADNTTIKETPAKIEKHDIICDDVEEEDNNSTARKYRLLTTGCLPLSYTFVLDSTCHFIKDRQSFSGHLPGKYITQRVLRI